MWQQANTASITPAPRVLAGRFLILEFDIKCSERKGARMKSANVHKLIFWFGVLLPVTAMVYIAVPFLRVNGEESFINISGTEKSLANSPPKKPQNEFANQEISFSNNYAIVRDLKQGIEPTFVGADVGVAFVFYEDSRVIRHIRTSMPIFKAFGVSLRNNTLLYSPLRNRIPSGDLYIENLESGEATKLTDDLVLEAAFSPDESKVAYTFASGRGFGMGITAADANQKLTLVSENILADFIQWSRLGDEIYFFETTDELDGPGVIPRKISIGNRRLIEMNYNSLPPGFPRLSTESEQLQNLRNSSNDYSAGHAELRYPFTIRTPDGVERICGGNFFGSTAIRLCENVKFPNLQNLADGQLMKIAQYGIIVRQFEPNRTTTNFIDWDGNNEQIAASPQVSYNLPVSKTNPNTGSFLVTRSGTGYSNACGLSGFSPHSGTLQFAFDMQKTGTAGQHVISSAEGTVVEAIKNINCNSGNSVDCELNGCGGMPACSTSQANGGWGNSVVILHADSTYSRYAHMQFNSVTVQNGESVCQGKYLGNQGGTGTSCGDFNGCGDHLHYQKQNMASGNSVSASFSDVSSNPLSCLTAGYTTGSTEVSSCSNCNNGTATLRNRDNGPAIHPPGSVLRTASDPTVYLIDSEGRKRPLSANALSQLYAQNTDQRSSTNFNTWVVNVSQDELDLFETGGSILGQFEGNNKPFPDGKFIVNTGNNNEISIVTGVGRRRPFNSASSFTGLGYDFDCATPMNSGLSNNEYNSYPSGSPPTPADAMPLLISSVNLSPAGPYVVGQNVTGSFTIRNVGYSPITMSNLGIGGRFGPNNTNYDMNFVSRTLAPGDSFSYTSQTRQLTNAGSYNFYAAYQETNGHWTTFLPASPGVVRSRTITVNNSLPPSPPTANPATNITCNSFTANWGSSSGATGYRLDLATNSTFTNFLSGYNNRDVGNVTSHNVPGINPQSIYYYRVRAYNPAGTSGNSSTQAAGTSICAPQPPTANAATNVSATAFSANWSASANATGYRLDVSTNSNFSSFVSGYNNLDVSNITIRGVIGLTPNTTYYYRLRAYNSGGTSGSSNTIQVTTLNNTIQVTVQTNPSGRSFTVDGTSYTSAQTFNWTSASSHTIATTSPQNGSAGTRYAWSNWSDGGAISHTVSPSSNTTFTSNFITQYQLTMNAGSGGTVAPPSGNWYNAGQGVQISATPNSGFTFNDWSGSGSGSYTGSNNPANITMNGPIQETASFAAPPSAPTPLPATGITWSRFTANWNPSSGATGYRLDVSTSSVFLSFVPDYQNLDVGNNTSRDVTGLSGGTTYYYRVRAYNSAGPSGNSGTAATLLVPVSPNPQAATNVTTSGFTANWNSANGAAGYRFDLSRSQFFDSFVSGYENKEVNNTNSLPIPGLQPGASYYYRLRAYNAVGTSFSSGGRLAQTLLSAPVATDATNVTTNSLWARWNNVSGALDYFLDVSTDSSFSTFVPGYQNKLVGAGFAPVNGLNADTLYFYRLRARSLDGVASGNSNTIQVRTSGNGNLRAKSFDYDADGKTDISVFRPSNATWYVLRSFDGGTGSTQFGLSNDAIVPADFDGDRKTDYAVWRGSNLWLVLNSSDNTVTVFGWGLPGDLPVPADYNGDQKADIAVYRPSESNWYRRDSDGQIHIYGWGLPGDKPAPADFNGDGVADMTVFRPSEGRWYTINSGDASIGIGEWGISGDIPIPADYSGDGRADYTVYRPSNQTWYRFHTNDSSIHVITWGLAGDLPVPGDYDGDGRSDLAVWRPSDTTWYLNTTTSGIYTQPFGLTGDKPTPNAFVY